MEAVVAMITAMVMVAIVALIWIVILSTDTRD